MSDLVKFDYSSLDAKTRKLVQQNTEDIRTIGKKMAEGFIQLGQKFSDTRDALRHKEGGFQAWFTHEGFDKTFVYKCMTIAENFSSVANSQHLNVGFEALYQLSLPGIPEAARVEAVERSAAGEKITIEAAKEIAEAHKDWRDKLTLEDWYPINDKLKIVIDEHFPTGNALHRKYPYGKTKTTYTKNYGNAIRQGGKYAAYKLIEPEQAPSYPKMEYTGEHSDEALAAAQWIQKEYLKRNQGWERYYDLLIISDPIYLKKCLNDTKDPDHVTFSMLGHEGAPAKDGVRWEKISTNRHRTTEPTAQPDWESFKMYPVDNRRKWVFDHPIASKEAMAIRDTWYPMCVLIGGASMLSRQQLEAEGWIIQPARGEHESDEQPEQAPKIEPSPMNWQSIGKVFHHHDKFAKTGYYLHDRENQIVYLQRFDRSMDATASDLYRELVGLHGYKHILPEAVRTLIAGSGNYELWTPLEEKTTPAATGSHYKPGMLARCLKCDRWHKEVIHDNWTLDFSPTGLIWKCPNGHRIADPLMDIVTIGELAHISQMEAYEDDEKIEVPSKFAAILIDPPWEYTTYSEDNGQGRSAEAHYPTMKAGDIAALPVGELAADDCALFMWATWPTIQQAFAVGTAWGFEYRTCAFTWAKVRKGIDAGTMMRLNEDSNWHMGMGFWTRANSEVCLLFVKGSPKRQNADVRQLIVASVRKHSQKPDEQYERIERLVNGPYLELFAREKRAGWYAWGNEVESDITFGGIEAVR